MDYFQNLTILEPTLARLLRHSKGSSDRSTNRSLSGLFKALRKDKRTSLVGDYLILSYILRETALKFPRHKWTKAQYFHALTFCRFWEEEGRKQKFIPKDHLKYVKA